MLLSLRWDYFCQSIIKEGKLDKSSSERVESTADNQILNIQSNIETLDWKELDITSEKRI